MWYEQKFPNILFKLSQRLQLGLWLSGLRDRFGWANWLGWKQWLVLFGFGAVVTAVEIHNHRQMWIEHKSGQTILTDHMLMGEIFFFGLILPILFGLVLSYTGRTAIERDKMARALELRQALVAKIHEAQNWDKLANLIVQTPSNVVPAERTWLLAKRTGEEAFNQIARWEIPGNKFLPRNILPNSVDCENCDLARAVNETRLVSCQCPELLNGNRPFNRYALWLTRMNQEKSVLLIDTPIERPLNIGQTKVLDDLGNEMSLAISNANLQFKNQRDQENIINERQRIARNLHDTLGQNISYLRLKLDQLQGSWHDPLGTHFDDDLSIMLKVADEAYEHVRNTLEELRVAEQFNLEKSIRLYAEQVSERAGIAIHIHLSGQQIHFSARQNRQIMYILREALNNVEKHANAANVTIHLMWRDGQFIMTVCDDGIGFEWAQVNTKDQYGISIMTERSRAINAELNIVSSSDEGTKLALHLPLINGQSDTVIIS